METDLVPLTETAMSVPYQGTSLSVLTGEVKFLLGKLEENSKKTLQMIFETGKRLVAAKEMLDHGQFIPWLEQNFAMSRMNANRYMRVYETYKDAPMELIMSKTIREAYIEAGIKKAVPEADQKTDEGGEHTVLQTMPAALTDRSQLVWLFRQPTRSGVTLKKHRVQAVNGQVYIYRKDTNMASPALDLYLPRPAGFPEPAWQKAIDAYVVATELYLQTLEEFEERGIVSEEAV